MQAGFCTHPFLTPKLLANLHLADHLTLTRLLSAVPSLIPSHKLTFFISRDPLSSSYEEQSLALRTVQAFVEHHLFVLLPGWLNAVKVDEWERLQKALKEQPVRRGRGVLCEGRADEGGFVQPSTPARSGAVTQTFIEKLQASAKVRAITSVCLPELHADHSPVVCTLVRTADTWSSATKGDVSQQSGHIQLAHKGISLSRTISVPG